MKKYLILAETVDTGYFVEIQQEYEIALKREKLFFELAFNPPTDRKRMRETFQILGTYPVNDKFAVFFDHIAGSSNGAYSTYILEIEDDFSFEEFASLRNSSRKITFQDSNKELFDLEEKYGQGMLKGGWVN
jgi:hypothetical protein